MLNSSSRTAILDALIRQVGVPLAGVSVTDISTNPPVVALQFEPSATAEQVALAESILAVFDWRRRRALNRTTVVTALNSLTAGQRLTIQIHMVAEYLRNNPGLATAIGIATGTPVVVDEVDPIPT